ncbi:MAG: hypothetical protein KHZ27_02090 [Fusobacterium sp.]|jgi:hypothetical protein|nr:hypothetical protein [Fusobacterium sp.]
MNKILKNTRHPLVTAKAILNGDDEWLFNPLHKDHGWHFNNLEYLYQKGVIFKTTDNKYLFIKTDLELYVKHNGLSLKEKFEKDSLRNSVIATLISFLALIVSSIALYLEMKV